MAGRDFRGLEETVIAEAAARQEKLPSFSGYSIQAVRNAIAPHAGLSRFLGFPLD
jgi:hypothetical protein